MLAYHANIMLAYHANVTLAYHANVTRSEYQKYANVMPSQCQKNANCDAIWVPSIMRGDQFSAFLRGEE